MKRICSWCKKELGDVEETGDPDGLTTHGICAECAETLFSDLGTRVRKLLDKFSVPVVAVNERFEVVGVNDSAQRLLGKTAEEIEGAPCGEVFDCIHASEAGGCGGTDDCAPCEIRAAVIQTLETGGKLRGVPARITRATPEGPVGRDLVISTERVGSMVLLRIDTPDET